MAQMRLRDPQPERDVSTAAEQYQQSGFTLMRLAVSGRDQLTAQCVLRSAEVPGEPLDVVLAVFAASQNEAAGFIGSGRAENLEHDRSRDRQRLGDSWMGSSSKVRADAPTWAIIQ